MTDKDILDSKFYEWTAGKSIRDAMISVYSKIRDIPYAVVPELNSSENYVRMLQQNRGSCTPKHLLLANIFGRLGLNVLYVVYPYRWAEFEELYPPQLWKLALKMPPANHLACKVEIDGNLVLVDATVDRALEKLGLPVNTFWDGRSDTLLPVLPTGDEEIYSLEEAALMPPPQLNEDQHRFYDALNLFFQEVRDGGG